MFNHLQENRAHSLRPLQNRKTVIKLLEETEELKRIRTEGNHFPSIDFEELDNELKMLEVKDSVLSEEGLGAYQELLNSQILFSKD